MRKKTASSTRRVRRPANRSSLPTLDGFDRKILQALVDNARASNVEIAQKVGLSEAPCSRRIRRLESDEVIELVRMPLGRALELVWSGEIADAKSALALLHAAHRRGALA